MAAKRKAYAANNKTIAGKASVTAFLAQLDDAEKKRDCKTLQGIMRKATGSRARMWGTSIVGYGEYDYHYESGRHGSHLIVGFSPRASNLTVYIMPGFAHWPELMDSLGKYKTGKSCLYIKRIADIDVALLEQLIENAVVYMRSHYTTR